MPFFTHVKRYEHIILFLARKKALSNVARNILLFFLFAPSTQVDLVISVGGDGTVLSSSHFLGDNIPLLGVNSDPTRAEEESSTKRTDERRSFGALCMCTATNVEEELPKVSWESGAFGLFLIRISPDTRIFQGEQFRFVEKHADEVSNMHVTAFCLCWQSRRLPRWPCSFLRSDRECCLR